MTTGVRILENDGRVQIAASGGQTSLAFDFPIYDESHIRIIRTRAGVDTTLAITTNYTVPSGSIGVEAGGTVTLNTGATAGDVYTLLLDVPYARTTDFAQAGDFLAETLNLELDLITQQNQQIVRDQSLSLRLRDSTALSGLTVDEPEADAVLVFNATGDGVTNGPNVADIVSSASTATAAAATATAAASAASASETSAEAAAAAAAASAGLIGSNANVFTTLRNNIMVPFGPSTVAANNSAFEQICSKYGDFGIRRGKNGGRNGQYSMSSLDNIYQAVVAQKPAWVLMHGTFRNDMNAGTMADAAQGTTAGNVGNAKYSLNAALNILRALNIKVIVCPEMVEQVAGTARTNCLAWNAALAATIAARADSGILYVDTASLITDSSGNPLIPTVTTTASGTSGSPDIVVASATGILRGMHPDDSAGYITSFTGKPRIKNISGTTITLSGNLSNNLVSATVSFMTDYEDYTHYSTVGHLKCATAIYNAMVAAGWVTGYKVPIPVTSSTSGSNVENLATNGLALSSSAGTATGWFNTFTGAKSVTTNANFTGNVQRGTLVPGEATGRGIGQNSISVTAKQNRLVAIHAGVEASNFIENGAVYSVIGAFNVSPPAFQAGTFPDESPQPINFRNIDFEGKRSYYAEVVVPPTATSFVLYAINENEAFPSTAISSGIIDVGELMVVDIDDPLKPALSSSQWTTTGGDIYYSTGGVKIGAATAPAATSSLELEGTTKGLVLNRMTSAQRNTLALIPPVNGTMVFDTDLLAPHVYTTTGAQFRALCTQYSPAAFFSAGQLTFGEQGTNGSSITTLKAQDALAASNTVTLPSGTGTLALVGGGYTSTAQTITSGGLLTLAHGLTYTPDEFDCWLINVTAQGNWTTGNKLPTPNGAMYGGSGIQQNIYADATNVYVRFGSDSSPYAIGDKNTGAQVVLTNANWSFMVRAK